MESSQFRSSGFTLIEILLAIAVIGILATIGWQVYVRGVRQTEVRDTATQLEAALKLARSSSQSSGANQEFSWTVDTQSTPNRVTAYTVKNSFTNSVKTTVLDGRTIVTCLSDCTTPLVYRAPFGEIDAVGPAFEIASIAQGIGKRVVRVYGVTGKVVREGQ